MNYVKIEKNPQVTFFLCKFNKQKKHKLNTIYYSASYHNVRVI